jgi:ribosomal protein S18 acetylase RimI-like enzyme
MIEISEVRSKRDFREFIQFPVSLYRDDFNFVPALNISQQELFNRKKNPFFTHSKVDFFLAHKEKQVVGRIALIRNNNHIRHTGEQCGFFGFFETINDYHVAEALLDKACSWIKNEGLTSIVGPENFTTNDSCGMLISGFDKPAVFMMPYNKPYYNDFLQKYGFEKEMDLNSYFICDRVLKSPSYVKLAKKINDKLAASGITIRTISFKMLDQEIAALREVYNQSNMRNWGFLPMNEDEFKHSAHQLKQFVPEKLILLVEKETLMQRSFTKRDEKMLKVSSDHNKQIVFSGEKQQIGFLIALPDLNQICIRVKNGRLSLIGLLKFLWYKRKITNSRIMLLGILDEYRNRGIDVLLYKKIQENLATMGISHGEACYVMENNVQMNSLMEKIGGSRIKEYRIYRYRMHEA